MIDRSYHPQHSPPEPVGRAIVRLRWRQRRRSPCGSQLNSDVKNIGNITAWDPLVTVKSNTATSTDALSKTSWLGGTTTSSTRAAARFAGTTVQVRDTKDHGAGPVLSVDIVAWPGFIAEVSGAAAAGSNDALRIEHLRIGGARLHSLDGTITLTYIDNEWTAFTAGAADGEFTVPAAA